MRSYLNLESLISLLWINKAHLMSFLFDATGANCAVPRDLVCTVYPLSSENRPAGSRATDSHREHQHHRNTFPSICVETSIRLPVGRSSKVKIIYWLQSATRVNFSISSSQTVY